MLCDHLVVASIEAALLTICLLGVPVTLLRSSENNLPPLLSKETCHVSWSQACEGQVSIPTCPLFVKTSLTTNFSRRTPARQGVSGCACSGGVSLPVVWRRLPGASWIMVRCN